MWIFILIFIIFIILAIYGGFDYYYKEGAFKHNKFATFLRTKTYYRAKDYMELIKKPFVEKIEHINTDLINSINKVLQFYPNFKFFCKNLPTHKIEELPFQGLRKEKIPENIAAGQYIEKSWLPVAKYFGIEESKFDLDIKHNEKPWELERICKKCIILILEGDVLMAALPILNENKDIYYFNLYKNEYLIVEGEAKLTYAFGIPPNMPDEFYCVRLYEI